MTESRTTNEPSQATPSRDDVEHVSVILRRLIVERGWDEQLDVAKQPRRVTQASGRRRG